MQVICSKLPMLQVLMGAQTRKQTEQYRMLTYCKMHTVQDGVLFFNLLTKEMLLLSEQEADSLENFESCPKELADYLIANWFFVPYDMDDKKLYRQAKELMIMSAKMGDKTASYKIFTTLDCNARCFYCFELGSKRTPMSQETAFDVAKYIKDTCGSKIVRLAWFGGEPLFNSKVIDIICKSLAEAGIKFFSDMQSNGYLFDEDTIKKAKTEWNLRWVQITLDGTEEVYNRIKAYIDKGENAFERVTNNIENLMNAGIAVTVRLNIDEHNADNLFELCDYLAERFKGEQRFDVYPALLYETSESKRTDEERKSVYEKFFALQDYMKEKGIANAQKLSRNFKLNNCIADGGNGVVISTEGKLQRCDYYTEGESFGSIYSKEYDEEMIASWQELYPDLEECDSCEYYPYCFRHKKCPTSFNECFPELRTKFERGIKELMEDTYKQFKVQNKGNN